jgi:hypothetical protein
LKAFGQVQKGAKEAKIREGERETSGERWGRCWLKYKERDRDKDRERESKTRGHLIEETVLG